MPSIVGAHHMALTVRDADPSSHWYCDHSPIAGTPIGAQLVFRDPDHIHLGLCSPAT